MQIFEVLLIVLFEEFPQSRVLLQQSVSHQQNTLAAYKGIKCIILLYVQNAIYVTLHPDEGGLAFPCRTEGLFSG